jgi:hypothetical protein
MIARSTFRLMLLGLIGFSLWDEAHAGSVTAVTRRRNGQFAANPNGKFSVFAYSEQNGVKNATSSYNGGAANTYNTDSIQAPVPNVGNLQLSPIVGNKDVGKGAMGNFASASSDTGGSHGEAEFKNNGGGMVDLAASANTTQGLQQFAAGRSIDPIDVDPGSYDYSYSLEFSMEVFPTDPWGSLYADAVDTDHVDPLWELAIVAYGPIGSIGDLVITFTSDPSLGLNDAMVVSDLMSAIGVAGGVASLPEYVLFTTTYDVPSMTVYSDSAAATTASVPEPATVTLAMCGAALALWSARRRR